MKLPTIRELIHEQAKFLKRQDGMIWYQIIWSRCVEGVVEPKPSGLFNFPVPVDDAAGGEFGTVEKAVTLMRWIRKHLECLNGALAEGVYDQ